VRLLQGQTASPQRDVPLSIALNDLQRAQQRQSLVQAALEDARVAQASVADVLTVPGPTVEPNAPLLPRVAVNVFSAGVVGLLLALLIALLVDTAIDRPGSPLELAQAANVSPVGAVQRVKNPLADDAMEAFRTLCALLRQALGERPHGAILVTSATRGAGTTTVAAGLAVAFARAGDRVILVDANLRRPRMAELFSLDPSRGLTPLLTEHGRAATLEVQPTPIEGLGVLAAGSIDADSPDLLASRNLRLRLEELSTQAELVIIDAPSLDVSDPLALLQASSEVVVVLGRGSGARTARHAAADVRAAGGQVLALVVKS
jgi:Mrp family chromosome partitioning ATPase